MASLKLKVGDGTKSEDNVGGAPVDRIPDRKPYLVTAETGLFKNGHTYKRGDTVELDARTAESAIQAGDVEEIK